MSKQRKGHELVIERTCWVWAVSYKSRTGLFNTWDICGSEKKAKQVAKELKRIRKVPVDVHITPFSLSIEQHGLLGELRCTD